MVEALKPSGDTSGAIDSSAIDLSLARHNAVCFGPGRFHVNRPIASGRVGVSIRGLGMCSIIEATDGTFPIVRMSKNNYSTVADLWMIGGLNAVDLDGACRVTLSNVTMARTASHGIVLRDGTWIVNANACRLANIGGDGINTDGTSAGDGNAVSLQGVNIEGSVGCGIRWLGFGLSVSGCCVEGCKSPAILFDGLEHVAGGATVHGSYFENNGRANIEFASAKTMACHSISVAGNFFYMSDPKIPSIVFSGEVGESRRVVVDRTNMFSGSDKTWFIDAGDKASRCELHAKSRAKINCTNPELNAITFDGP
jgi:hypothetical protein